MKINPDVLKPHPLLALLPYRKLKQLLVDSAVSEHPKGSVVFREGEKCDSVYLIISGRCEGRVSGRNGASAVDEVYGPGDTLGTLAFLNDEPHRSTVTVSTHCVLLRIPTVELEGILSKDPAIAGRFSQFLTRRARLMHERHGPEGPRVRRVVSLVTLAPRLDSGAVTSRLGASLREITRQQVLLVHLIRNGTAAHPHEWVLREPNFGGEFSFGRQLHTNDQGYDELRLPVGNEPRYAAAIAPLISHCGHHYDYVLLHVDPELPPQIITECVLQADLAYVLVQPSVQSLYDFEMLTHALKDRSSAPSNHVKPIVFVQEPFNSDEFHAMFDRFGRPVHSFARGFPSSTQHDDSDRRFGLHINRIAREIARCRVGLALSSGGAKGLAHVGVIQVLEENGIEIDAIAGASMGAYVGSLWAYGLDGSALEKIAREHEGHLGLFSLIDPVLPPRRGFVRTTRVARRLHRSLGDAHFSDLVRPLRVLATHRETLESVVFSSGKVVKAVEASIAMPGICAPVMIDGEVYMDGGISDPLPIDVLEEMGIERIIAVNVIPNPELLRYWREREREQNANKKKRWSLGRFLNQQVNYFAHGNVFDTMIQAMNSVQMRVAEANTQRADVVLRPVSPDAYWHDFTRPGKYIELGRTTAEAQIAEIKSLFQNTPKDAPPALPKKLAAAAALAAA